MITAPNEVSQAGMGIFIVRGRPLQTNHEAEQDGQAETGKNFC